MDLSLSDPESKTRTPRPATFAMVTFGCKVNQYESQAIRERWAGRGLIEVGPGEPADWVLVNTCTVTEVAAAEAQRVVRRLARRHPFAEIVVTGCAADSHREEFLALAGVRRVVGHSQKASLGEDPRLSPADLQPSIFDLAISKFEGHARGFLKVQDGCDLSCSFCIIPQVRGKAVSRSLDSAVAEARLLVAHGHPEIVLTGVHLGAYGKDLAGRSMLPDLVQKLLEVPGLARLRLSSIEANEITDRLVDLMAADPRFCPHLHVPLQSGDDGVLRAMRRRYNAGQYLAALGRVADRVHEPAFTTDVIVGFPGETERQFEATMDLCRRVGFSRIHVFPYSRRRGTEASLRPDLPGRIKKERLRRLERLAAGLTEVYARRFVGRPVEVLVEEGHAGYTERYLRARAVGPPRTILRRRVEKVVDGEIHTAPV